MREERPAPEVRLVGGLGPAPVPDEVSAGPPVQRRRWAAGLLVLLAAGAVGVHALRDGPAPTPPAPGPTSTSPAPLAAARLYVASCDPGNVYRVPADGVPVRLSGTPSNGSAVQGGGPVPVGRSDCPGGLAFDGAGLLHVVSTPPVQVRVVAEGGAVTSGGLARFDEPGTADGRLALGLRALLISPAAVGTDRNGTVYVGTAATTRVQRLDAAGALVPLTDEVPGLVDESARPAQIAVGDDLSAFFADLDSNRVFRVDPRGVVTTVAGTGVAGSGGDGGPAARAQLDGPRAVAVDRQGRLYVSESRGHRVRRIDPDGTIRTIAGTGRSGATGDGGPATAATLESPGDLAVDPDGNVYVVDLSAGAVRRIDPAGLIETLGT